MRHFIVPLALAGLTAASPLEKRQDINWDIVDANPTPTYTMAVGVTAQTVVINTASILADATSVTSMTVDATDAADASPTADSRKVRRDGDCAVQPSGATGAPTYSPDSPSAFAAATTFGDVASAAPTPSGYENVFTNLDGSNNAYGYMGFTTLDDYDTVACADQCNDINGCMAVNIFFERDPSLDPGSECPDPSSVTMIKCVFWGGPVDAGNAVNLGQYRDEFEVLVAGSNGYVNQSIATPSGFLEAQYLGDAAINAPYDSQGFNTYMGSNMFPPGPFNAQLCADFCTAQNNYNLAHPPTDGTPVQTCQYFNTYLLYINTTADILGQYCVIYSESWDPSYATNYGQNRGSDDYLIEYSYSFTNATNPGAPNAPGAAYQARNDVEWPGNSASPYCSSILGYATATSQSTPDVLTKYPATIQTSGCSLAVPSPTPTS